MRRVLVLAVVALVVFAGPAAAGEAPSAKELVKTLVKADVCRGPVLAVDARGTTFSCDATGTDGVALEVEVHAFKSKAAALKALDAFLADECAELVRLGVTGVDRLDYTVAKTWWTNSFVDRIGVPLREAIGGRVRSYACPD